VPIGDAGALGKTALAVLRGDEPGRAGIAHEWVERHYDIDHIAASLREYLEAVAGLT